MPTNIAAPQAPPTTEEQWAIDYLAYIGAPASGPDDPRVQFLVQWQNQEGTFGAGNEYNPLDTELQGPGAGPQYNTQGVQTYTSAETGFQATEATMEQSYDTPILTALQNPKTSLNDLYTALTGSNWTGSGDNSAAEAAYSSAVASDSTTQTSEGPTGPQGGTSNAPTDTGNPSSTASTGTGSGFLHALQGVLNPSYGNTTSFLFNPGNATQKVVVMVLARGGFMVLGLGGGP